jgi:transcriptional regulator with XRE-family HTH domain
VTDKNAADASRDDKQKSIGARLREARETLGITQVDASAALRIPRTSVTAMEKGTRNVSATELTELSALYRRSVEWILGAELNENESTTALYRAASGLSEDDKAQVLKFAQFLAAAGPAPTGPYPADDEE